eukprot:m.454276 g.454276  ORF g.454276 m.454276 type:complete len:508 (+) comp21567_c0_seq2:238-1761(+)
MRSLFSSCRGKNYEPMANTEGAVEEGQPQKHDDTKKSMSQVGVLGLASLAFFTVAGSPAGSEDAVAAGGPLLALIGFIVFPLVWSVPEALITAELSTTFPHNGGFVIWVNEAFGEQWGYMEGLLKWGAGVLDNAVYPVMMVNYGRQIIPGLQPAYAKRICTAAITVVLTFAQYFGLEIVGGVSVAVIVVTMMPFVVLVCWGLRKMQWDQLLATKSDGDVDWGLLLTTLFWNLNYWDSVSTMASEVKNPARTFPRALVLAMVFTVGMYFLVLGVAIGNAPGGAQHEWNNSELASAGLWVAGDWLRIWIVASVTISAIGLFLAEMSSDIYQLDGMADMGMIPQLFRLKNRYGVPVVALLLQASIILVIVQCIDTLEDIISLEMISYCFAQLLEFAAFARLRWTHPDAVRPYKVPGGKWASVAIIVPGTSKDLRWQHMACACLPALDIHMSIRGSARPSKHVSTCVSDCSRPKAQCDRSCVCARINTYDRVALIFHNINWARGLSKGHHG